MLDDEELDERLKQAARQYHEPPDPPREAMWQAIQRARRARTEPRPVRVLAFARRWMVWAAAAAAVLAIGIGIGRWTTPRAPAGTPEIAQRPEPARGRSAAYGLATMEHLSQAEAFLTLFRASVRAGGDDRLASATARELLASNRLLLDSPAGQDRRTRLLLQDLELVLAEIAQLSNRPAERELDLIREGMERGAVLSRLRTAVPAGTTPMQGAL
jgi:hypothetical protein